MWTLAPLVLLLPACGGGSGGRDDAPAESTTDSAPADTQAEIEDGCDEGETPTYPRYEDHDGDEWGADGTGFYACSTRYGAAVAGDCDDEDAEVHPEADELCAGPDMDCDGVIGEDDATDAFRWYADEDGDGYGDALLGTGCTPPEGAIFVGFDCDDEDPEVHPDAVEVCDGVDQDCNYQIDDGAPGTNVFCYDYDGDDYGNPEGTTTGCRAPSRYVEDCTDCDDRQADVHPDSTVPDCDGAGDGNCDGVVDAILDTDGDGFTACDECDDLDPAVRPGGADVCGDGVDGDCDGGDDACPPDELAIYGAARGGERVSVIDALGVADVNGDGIADVLTGDFRSSWGGGSGGGVFAFLGPMRRDRDAMEPDLAWVGTADCLACGYRFVAADFDHDGVVSLVVADPYAAAGGSYRGAAHLLRDPLVDTLDAPTLSVVGDNNSDELGLGALAVGPDLDGDGADDLYVGTTTAGVGGVVIGVSSAATGTLAAADATLEWTAESSGNEFGTSLAIADTDGDGLDDVAVGAPGFGKGRLYRFLGPLPPTAAAADADDVLVASDDFGDDAVAAGDLDEDGIDDILASECSSSSKGTAWLVPGGDWPDDSAGLPWSVTGDTTGEWFGCAIAAIAPDYVFVGAVAPVLGDASLYTGPWTGAYSRGDAILTLPGVEQGMGYGLAPGDLDADGIMDLAVVETRSDLLGAVWLWSGTSW